MGNYCLATRKENNNVVEESMLQQIQHIRTVPYEQQVFSKFGDKSLIDLLRVVNVIQDVAAEESVKERESFHEEVTDVFSENIINELNSKVDYDTNPLEGWILCLDDIKSPCMLRVYLKQIDHQGNKINATRSEFVVPCKPRAFIDYMGNFQAQKDLDPRIDQFFPISQHPDQMETKVYLSYKKILMVSPRDFVYHKKTKLMDDVKDIWCDGSKSVTDKQFPVGSKIRGEILISGYVIQPLQNVLEEESFRQRFQHLVFKANGFSFVKMYSECDFKMSAPLFMAKGQVSSEMQKYINLVYRALQ